MINRYIKTDGDKPINITSPTQKRILVAFRRFIDGNSDELSMSESLGATSDRFAPSHEKHQETLSPLLFLEAQMALSVLMWNGPFCDFVVEQPLDKILSNRPKLKDIESAVMDLGVSETLRNASLWLCKKLFETLESKGSNFESISILNEKKELIEQILHPLSDRIATLETEWLSCESMIPIFVANGLNDPFVSKVDAKVVSEAIEPFLNFIGAVKGNKKTHAKLSLSSVSETPIVAEEETEVSSIEIQFKLGLPSKKTFGSIFPTIAIIIATNDDPHITVDFNSVPYGTFSNHQKKFDLHKLFA
jgi:hypothetical protein